jgi:hypothetical protein
LIFSLNLDDEEPRNERYDEADFSTNSFIMNMGSLYVMLLWYAFCFLVLPFTKLQCCKTNPRCRKVGDYFTKDLMWNSPIEFFNSSYMEILFSVILNSGKLDWSTKSLWLNNISWGFCLVFIVVAFPIW